VADEDVVDEFVAAVELAAEAAGFGNAGREVPEALAVALVGAVEAGRPDLGARGSEQELGGGGQRLVVEVAEHDQGALLSVAVETARGGVAQRDGLGGA
jgi:hypothetical protein